MLTGAIIVIVLLVIGSVLLLIWPRLKLIYEKKNYKKSMNHLVYAIARDSDFYLLNKIEIPIENGKCAHIDHILFSDKYVYCIGDAYYDGPLSGKYTDQRWFKYDKMNNFEHVTNPMALHRMRLEYLKNEITDADDLFIPIIVVPDSCFLDKIQNKPLNEFICRQSELRDIIAKKEKENVAIINPVQLNALVHDVYERYVK